MGKRGQHTLIKARSSQTNQSERCPELVSGNVILNLFQEVG